MTRLVEALTRANEIRRQLVTREDIVAFDEIVAAAEGYQVRTTMAFEYQVGDNRLDRYDNLRAALDRAEYLNGPWLDQIKELARLEQEEEDLTGVITSNAYRFAYTRALEERPVRVMMRQVTPWRLP